MFLAKNRQEFMPANHLQRMPDRTEISKYLIPNVHSQKDCTEMEEACT
jgi:hypothetical protein